MEENVQIIVKNKKNLVQAASGIVLIILTFIINGVLSFINVGFDFENIFTSSYWAHFFVLFASEMAVMFGMFIIQRIKDLNNEKITDLQEHIDKKREVVYGVDKVAEAEAWLRDVYNYREKLIMFENRIKKLYSKLIIREPKQEERFYKIKKRIYERNLKLREFYKQQFEYIKKDKSRIQLFVKHNKNEEDLKNIEDLTLELKSNEYAFNSAKIHYKDVYWGNLLSDIEETKNNNGTPFFNERKELSKNIIKHLGYGLITSSFVSALVFPSLNSMGWDAWINIIMNVIILTFFTCRGVVLSNKIILGTYYKALEKRKSIYNQMLKDLAISKIVIEDYE